MSTDAPTHHTRSGLDRRAVPRGGRRSTDQTRSRTSDRIPHVPQSVSAPTILVVDDYRAGREMNAEILRTSGFRVVEAATAGEALQKVGAHRPDVVLLDVLLPDADGIDIIPQLRRCGLEAMPKIVVCTAALMTDNRSRSAAAAADMFIPKPYDIQLLVAQIRSLLQPTHPTV